jgi:subtilisin family serine protease
MGSSAHAQGVLKPLYGNIQPFYGDIQPSFGNLHPFYGNLHPFFDGAGPFWGDPTVFWGNDAAFSGNTQAWWGTLDPVAHQNSNAPAYLTIRPFWNKTFTSWTTLFTAWRQINPATATAASYAPIEAQLKAVTDASAAFWGASVKAQTGKSFQDAVTTPLLAKWGIDLNKPLSLQSLSPSDQASFFLDWYDHVMNFAGTDHVDWWMKVADWSPSLTQTQGSGARTTIGLLDFTVVGDTTLKKSIVKYDGVSTFSNGHGAAVGSLLVGAFDGKGVMGIAPQAKVIAYNPFDDTGTASWADVADGVAMLASNGASVVNMSLGVPGTTLSQGWNDYVFSNAAIARASKNVVFVTAAGNDGISQTNNINWNFANNPTLIVVGSVDAAGNISNFSNRPGTACLLDHGVCNPGNQLMYHFIVAPGEMILVSDDHGGTVRQSGTSLAAPLVSGAIALLQNRWPWLANFPQETAYIILHTAKDLGAPGPDPVYGMGLLDIQASQSPLSFDSLHWMSVNNGGKITEIPAQSVLSRYKNQNQNAFDASGLYFYAFETVGNTIRDFAIPMSSKLIGQTFTSMSGYQAYFQGYLLAQMDAWAKSQGHFAAADSGGLYRLPNRWGADLTLSMAPRAPAYGFRNSSPYDAAVRLQGEGYRLSAGFGDGAPALAGQSTFAVASDFQMGRGGANPLLGLASGGAYADWSLDLGRRLQLSVGATQRSDRRDGAQTPAFDRPDDGAQTYSAGATRVAVSYDLTPRLRLTGAYTHLREASAVLGVQSLDPRDFSGGSRTDGVTFGLDWAATSKVSLGAAVTAAKTTAPRADQAMAVAGGGLYSQAFQVSVVGRDLFAKGDAARLTLAQPLAVSQGHLNIRDVEVVDRMTGEIGVVDHVYDVAQAASYAGEALYGRQAFDGQGELSLFGRVQTDPQRTSGQPVNYTAGGRIRIAF